MICVIFFFASNKINSSVHLDFCPSFCYSVLVLDWDFIWLQNRGFEDYHRQRKI